MPDTRNTKLPEEIADNESISSGETPAGETPEQSASDTAATATATTPETTETTTTTGSPETPETTTTTSTTETPAATETTTTTETTETPETPEAPATPSAPMPQYEETYQSQVKPVADLTQEQIDEAKKKGKREARRNTAAQILDTLARVTNYIATTQGAPSAKWSNHNKESDPDTYLTKLKKEHQEELNNYWKNMGTAAGIDTSNYSAKLGGWAAAEKEKRESELQPYKIAESQGKANKANAEAAVKAIEAQFAPQEHEAKIKKLEEEAARARAQGNSALASAANSYALAERHRGDAEKNRWYFMGEEYRSLDEYKKQVNKFWAEHQHDKDPISRTETLAGEGTDLWSIGKSTSKEVDKDIHLLAGELENRYMKGSLAQGN